MSTGPSVIFHLVYFGYEPTVVDSQVLIPATLLARDGISVRIVFFESLGDWLRPWRIVKKRRRVAARNLAYMFLPRVPRNFLWFNSICLVLRLWPMLSRSSQAVIHSRGFQGAALALGVKRFFPQVRVLCDARGIESEEYAYGSEKKFGRPPGFLQRWWKRRLEAMERKAVRESDAVFTVSRAMKPYLEERSGVSLDGRWSHIPCAVKADDFSRQRNFRAQRRRELGVENRIVIVYSGTLSAWQIPTLLPDVFEAFRKVDPACFFLGLTPDVDALTNLFHRKGFDARDMRILSVPYADMPSYLAAGDIGLLIREEHPLNRYACPTKFAEYLAMGLHVVATPAVQEVADVIREESAGTLVEGMNEEHLSVSAQSAIASIRQSGAAERIVAAARRFDWLSFVPLLKKWYLSSPK